MQIGPYNPIYFFFFAKLYNSAYVWLETNIYPLNKSLVKTPPKSWEDRETWCVQALLGFRHLYTFEEETIYQLIRIIPKELQQIRCLDPLIQASLCAAPSSNPPCMTTRPFQASIAQLCAHEQASWTSIKITLKYSVHIFCVLLTIFLLFTYRY